MVKESAQEVASSSASSILEQNKNSPSDDQQDDASSSPQEHQPPSSSSLPYITTSDILSRMNQEFQKLGGDGDDEAVTPMVELQRRMPDGSTRRCTDDELKASDLQTKLQQTAKLIQDMTPKEKAEWATHQRLVGNSLFQAGEYAHAMDIYLTCLVVKDELESDEFIKGTFVPVLNNLAQCTLQLGMYKKTIQFCNLCFEELDKKEASFLREQLTIPLSKIHYKRAKAYRLSGEYPQSRKDLRQGLTLLEKVEDNDESSSVLEYKKALEKELRKLKLAEREGRRNQQRTKKAMKSILNNSNATSSTTTTESSTSTSTAAFNDTISGSLYEHNPSGTKRQYSTLRAPKKNNQSMAQAAANKSDEDESRISFSRYYWDMVARVCETLLIWLGDEETIANYQQKHKQKGG
jgi:tetratricopeptide (TPR) repeat protein